MAVKTLRKQIRLDNQPAEIKKLKKKFRAINPFADAVGSSFRMPLNYHAEELIRSEIKSLDITSKERKSMISLLNKSDTRDLLTIFTQELLSSFKSEKDKDVELLAGIKLAIMASVLPVRKKSGRSHLQRTAPLFENLAVTLLSRHHHELATKLKESFSKNEYVLNDFFAEYDLDPLRLHYFAKYITVTGLISGHISTFKEAADIPIDNVYHDICVYHLLFNETVSSLKSKKLNTLVGKLGYNRISKDTLLYYKGIEFYLHRASISFAPSYLTHITESSTKVYLSDLPPLTPTKMIVLGINYLFLIGWASIVVLPLIWMIALSFNGSGQNILGDHTNPGNADRGVMFHYKTLWEQTNFKYWLQNSLFVAFSSMTLIVIFTVLIAYSFSRFNFTGKKASLMTVMLIQMIPNIAALTAFLILFTMLRSGLNISMHTFLIIIYSGGAISGNTFILKGYFDSLPRDLDDAASIDGASRMRTFTSILIPLAKPMIAIIALWSFIGPFGDVILPRLLTDGTAASNTELTMAAGLQSLIVSSSTGGQPFQYTYLAGAVVTAVPITLAFLFAQRYMVGGLTSGSVK